MALRNTLFSSANRLVSSGRLTLARAFHSDLIQKDVTVELQPNGDNPGRIGFVKLNRPDKLNALTVEMGEEFTTVVNALKTVDDLRAVVLTGEGRAFSAGGDLLFLKERSEDSAIFNSEEMRAFYQRFLNIRSLSVPVIAAINGPAIGAGMCLAAACDIRLATNKAKIGYTFASLGLHPGMGATHILPSLIGPQLAAKMLLTGEVIFGDEAKATGLVLDTAPTPEELLETAIGLAQKIGQQSPVAVRGTVRSLRLVQEANGGGLDRSLWREADAQAHSYSSADIREGIDAVIEKRSPVFQNIHRPHKDHQEDDILDEE